MSTPSTAYKPPVDRPPPLDAGSSPYGGFWVRLAAHFVDGIIIWLGAMVIILLLFLMLGTSSGDMAGNVVMVLLVIGGQLYHAWFVSSPRMATPGKRLCGLYVTDLEGHRLGFGHALGRNLAAFFSYLTLYIGFIMAGFTDRKQALHDKLAGTLVHRQPGGSAGIVIGIVVGAFFLVAIVGILAAVAIPAYQDYTVRAHVNGVYQAAVAAKAPIADYAGQHGAWPTTWQQVGLEGGQGPMGGLPERYRKYVKDIRLAEGGSIVVSLDVSGKQGDLRLTPLKTGDAVEWKCSSSPEVRRFVPPSCRE